MDESTPEQAPMPALPAPATTEPGNTSLPKSTGFTGYQQQPDIDINAVISENTPLFGALLLAVLVIVLIVNLIRRQQGFANAPLKPHIYPEESVSKYKPNQPLTDMQPLPPKKDRAIRSVPSDKQHPRLHRFQKTEDEDNSNED